MPIKVVNHPDKPGSFAIRDTDRGVYFLSPLGDLIHTANRYRAEEIARMWERGAAEVVRDQPRRLELYRRRNGYR